MGTALVTVTSLVLMTYVAGVLSCNRVPRPRLDLRCPASQNQTAPMGSNGVHATWTPPDCPDHSCLQIVQHHGPASGSFLPGPCMYTMSYLVTFNCHYFVPTPQCSFHVNVHTITCPMPPALERGYRRCSTQPINIYGAECRHTCVDGLVLVGPSLITCGHDGRWNPDIFPTCQPVTCGDPPEVDRGQVSCPQGHGFPSVCPLLCEPGFQPQGATFIRCQKTGHWTQADPCIDVEPPRFPSGCPANQKLTCGPLRSPVILTWDDLVVMDNDQVNNVTSSYVQGSLLGPGVYTVKITASDLAGNVAWCTFTVSVTVVTCLPLNAPQNSQVTCTHGYVEGSQCTVTCNHGYELQGQGTMTCQASQQWSCNLPICQEKSCSELPVVPHGHVVCQVGQSFGALCLLTCDPGFQPEGMVITQCKEDGTWTPTGVCKDITPPEFVNGCVSNIRVMAAALGQPTMVSWTNPHVKDNSGSEVTIECSPKPGSVFKAGSTTVKCTATDGSGNSACCTFWVIVIQLTCHKPDLEDLAKDKVMTYDCPDGHVYGASCTLDCGAGHRLEGPSSITCQKDAGRHPPTVSWQWQGNTPPHCDVTGCPQLPPPQNGALTCYPGLNTHFCYLSCMEPYDVPPATPTDLFICSSSVGIWRPPAVPDCCIKRAPQSALVLYEVLYYSDVCQNNVDQLKHNFIACLDNVTSSGCSNHAHCTIDHLQVHCGPIVRERRSLYTWRPRASPSRSLTLDLYPRPRRVREARYQVVFNFTVRMEPAPHSDMMPLQQQQLFQDLKTSLHNTLVSQSQSGDLDIAGLTLDHRSVDAPAMTFQCPSGTVSREKNGAFYCLGCSAGYYAVSGQCQPCPRGQYSEVEEAPSCLPCPHGWSTRTPGASNRSMCEEQCRAGSMSSDGFQPCELCPLGHYQSRDGALTCDLCPVSTWTQDIGTNGSHLCLSADVVLTNNSVSADVGGKWTSLTVSLWISLTSNSSADVTLRAASGEALLSYSVHNSTGASLSHRGNGISAVSQALQAGSWSRVTFLVLPPGAQRKHLSGKTTVMTLTQLSLNGYTLSVGSINGKVVISGLAAYGRELTTEEMASGDTSCMVDNSESLLTWLPALDVMSLPSQCDAVDECQSDPCENDGLCENRLGSFLCRCQGGWRGDNCHLPPHPCHLHHCLNNATCLPREENEEDADEAGSSYSCVCPPGYTGTLCGDRIVAGGWGEWSEYTECSADCRGHQHRRRECNNPPPSKGGDHCPGVGQQTRDCGDSVCMVTGNWSDWTTWSDCSASCEGGETIRHRTCDTSLSSEVVHVLCHGQDIEIRTCNAEACPVHGGWGNWSNWSTCSVTCGTGTQSRERLCDHPVPINGGHACSGSANETRPCQLAVCPECSPILGAPDMTLSCTVTHSPAYLKTCRLQCPHGAVPSYDLQEYTCGHSTSYLWHNQLSRDEPMRVPPCLARRQVNGAVFRQRALMEAGCDETTQHHVVNEVTHNLAHALSCLAQGTCRVHVHSACRARRRKRNAPSLAVTVELTFSNEANITAADNTSVAALDYEDLVALAEDSITTLARNQTKDIFLVVVGNQTICTNINSTDFDLNTSCSPGEIYAEKYCVQCPPGTMEVKGSCQLCPLGHYQDEVGSTSCKACPEGQTTDFVFSTSIAQCYLPNTRSTGRFVSLSGVTSLVDTSTTSVTEKTVPASEETTSTVEEATSTAEETTSTTEETTSTTEETTSTTGETTSTTISTTEEITSTTQKITSTTEETTSTTEEATSTIEKPTSSTEKTTSTSEETTSTTEKSTSSIVGTTSTAEKTTSAAEKTTSAAEKTTSPSVKTTSTAEKTTSTAEKTTSPSEKTTSPSEKTTSTAEKTTSPSEKTTSVSGIGSITTATEKIPLITTTTEDAITDVLGFLSSGNYVIVGVCGGVVALASAIMIFFVFYYVCRKTGVCRRTPCPRPPTLNPPEAVPAQLWSTCGARGPGGCQSGQWALYSSLCPAAFHGTPRVAVNHHTKPEAWPFC